MALVKTTLGLVPGNALEATALGGQILKGSWAGGAGGQSAEGFRGGFILGSFNALNSAFSQSAFGAFSDWFGSNGFASAGYYVQPVGVAQIRAGSQMYQVYPTFSQQGSIFVLFPLGTSTIQSNAAQSWIPGLSVSANFVWWGFVISAPG